ncbi:MAG TPA: hypothetical protein ENI13_00120 [candidate division CPR3 bacterium]|uniref:Transcription factor zinc-finger domain-containing protein n=1 Tax=candidate division CPR3 bacterium TaxID=2268181 RepID=A0A7C1NZ72_UNCC3|nr:hypothetical protein [candidate division CPR3 bacterium]
MYCPDCGVQMEAMNAVEKNTTPGVFKTFYGCDFCEKGWVEVIDHFEERRMFTQENIGHSLILGKRMVS